MTNSLELSVYERDLLESYFDERYYLSANPDLAIWPFSLLEHYHKHGWREGRNPNVNFSTNYYLKRYPDIEHAGINPLLHYAMAGRHETRQTSRRLDSWRTRLDDLYGSHPGLFRALSGHTLSVEQLMSTLSQYLPDKILILSVSHDDYAVNVGGLQNVVHDEQQAANDQGWNYLHVAPAFHIARLAEPTAAHSFEIGLRLNGVSLGLTTMDRLIEVIRAIRPSLPQIEVVVHHLMSHSPELISDLIKVAQSAKPFVWAHDFFIACPSYALLRNDVVFCGGPPPTSTACRICKYGPEREDHSNRMRRFFEENKPILMAPSQSALRVIKTATDLAVTEYVETPLAKLLAGESRHRRASGRSSAPLRIAHVGARVFHKGWPIFEELALKHRNDSRYKFYQLGADSGAPMPDGIANIPVHVTRADRQKMVQAIARYEIDVALIWSFWPETFCFTAYEALAGGAFILTNEKAGNVAALVNAQDNHGLVLRDETELRSYFSGDKLVRGVGNSRRTRGAIVTSSNTVGWMSEQIYKQNENNLWPELVAQEIS